MDQTRSSYLICKIHHRWSILTSQESCKKPRGVADIASFEICLHMFTQSTYYTPHWKLSAGTPKLGGFLGPWNTPCRGGNDLKGGEFWSWPFWCRFNRWYIWVLGNPLYKAKWDENLYKTKWDEYPMSIQVFQVQCFFPSVHIRTSQTYAVYAGIARYSGFPKPLQKLVLLNGISLSLL